MATKKPSPAEGRHCERSAPIPATIEQRLAAIESRNARVESNKAWETSLTRRLTVSAITYATASAVLYTLLVPDWYLGSIIPVCGYWLSTLSLPILRRWWESSWR
ncbi:MAG: hypothetical protein GC129_04655 [Proteobacteria bacterium]|nr:hypothetical protein [Pseudomonadota bacterium]